MLDLQKRGMRHEPFPGNAHMAGGQQPVIFDSKEPMHGQEFFFSNILAKIYQIPMLFSDSSEFGVKPNEGTFIVMLYEKIIKKRAAKPKDDRRLIAINKVRKSKSKRHAMNQLMIRESKMRRFCNFWLILFNVRNLKPFSQFIKVDDMKELKMRITLKVQQLHIKNSDNNRLERCVSKISEISLQSPSFKIMATKEAVAAGNKSGSSRINRFGQFKSDASH